MGRQEKAIKLWDKSIGTGEKLGNLPELARTYVVVGERLLEKKSRCHELKGIKAGAYLEKARTLFEERDLQWDLEGLGMMKEEKR